MFRFCHPARSHHPLSQLAILPLCSLLLFTACSRQPQADATNTRATLARRLDCAIGRQLIHTSEPLLEYGVLLRDPNPRARFVRVGALSTAGDEVVSQINGAAAHALDPDTFHREKIARAHNQCLQSTQHDDIIPCATLEILLRDALAHLLRRLGYSGHHQADLKRRVDMLSARNERLADPLKPAAPRGIDSEAIVTDWWRRYRESVDAHIASEVAAMKNPVEIRARIRAAQPQHVQYQRLKASLASYRQIAAASGFERVARAKLTLGVRSAIVTQLKARLKQERFFAGPIDDSFGNPLTDAIRS